MNNYGPKHFNQQFREDPDPFGYYSSEYEYIKYERTLSEIKRQRQPENVEKILELGCANGAFIQRLRSRFETAEITAVDFSNKALEIARDRVSEVTFRQSEMTNFVKQTAENFDLIIASECLYYLSDSNTVTDLIQFVDDLYECLRSCGSVISANIYGHDERDNVVMTETTVDVLRILFERRFDHIKVQSFTEPKGSGSDERIHTYKIWSMLKTDE